MIRTYLAAAAILATGIVFDAEASHTESHCQQYVWKANEAAYKLDELQKFIDNAKTEQAKKELEVFYRYNVSKLAVANRLLAECGFK